MRARKLALAVLTSVLIVGSAPAQTPTTDLPEAIRTDLVKRYSAVATETRYFAAAADLNADGRAEIVVYVDGPSACGSGGCHTFIYTPNGSGYRQVTSVSVTWPPIRISPRSNHGWRNLMVEISGGGIEPGTAELSFDGVTYASNPTVAPARRVTDLSGATIVINFTSLREGKPLQPR